MACREVIIDHYKKNWDSSPMLRPWNMGSMRTDSPAFRILEFPPTPERQMWTYATCGMSNSDSKDAIELHLFSNDQNEANTEILTAIAHYHLTSEVALSLWHTVNFGKPWVNNSECRFGLISLPYLDGENLENLELTDKTIKFYWLIPITEKELNYRKKFGVESLEDQFEASNFNYSNPLRNCVIASL